MSPKRASNPITSTNTNTCWVFVAGKAEPRHLFDIVFGIHALRRRGVPAERIFVFADHPAVRKHFDPYGIGNVFPARDVITRLPALPPSELIVVVATGHGDRDGIPADNGPSINPTQLLAATRACPGIKGGVIVLTQCFAGLFNYSNAGDAPNASELCLIGATSLNLSISSPMKLPQHVKTLDGSDGFIEWIANVFLVRFFEWMVAPRDVDGDGRCTLMDAYKHASVIANDDLRSQKGLNHIVVGTLQADMVRLAQALQAQTDPKAQASLMLALNAKQQQLNMALENLYVHQEPWVLHARFASEIDFPLPAQSAVAASPAPAPPVAALP